MAEPRAALADLLRPRLKPPGFNDRDFLREFDRILDEGGMRRDGLTRRRAAEAAMYRDER